MDIYIRLLVTHKTPGYGHSLWCESNLGGVVLQYRVSRWWCSCLCCWLKDTRASRDTKSYGPPLDEMSPLLFLLAVLPLLLLRAPATTADWQYDPSPNPKSVVKAGKARFTVLTDRIVRMEWGVQVDAATWGVLNRNLPAPSFQHSVERGVLTITTQALKVGSTGALQESSIDLDITSQNTTYCSLVKLQIKETD